MSIYSNPELYAKKTHVSLEQSKERCKHFLEIQQKTQESKKCPKCGKYTLEYEGGEYESGIRDYIRCENDEVPSIDEHGEEYLIECEFTSDVTEEYYPLMNGYDMDVVLYFGIQIKREGLEKVEKELGCSWDEFIENENQELLST